MLQFVYYYYLIDWIYFGITFSIINNEYKNKDFKNGYLWSYIGNYFICALNGTVLNKVFQKGIFVY